MICLQCGIEFASDIMDQKFCSKACRKKKARALVAGDASLTSISDDKSILIEDASSVFKPAPMTRAEAALSSLSTSRLNALMCTGARYSASTLKKHGWVTKMYENFISAFSFEAWPLDPAIVSGFIRFLGLEACYAVSSIEDVIIPSLKRLNIEKTGSDITLECSQFISQALKDVKNSKSSLYSSEGKDPAIIPDVKRIIECTPDGIPSKAAEASLWLTALSTGARAITCSNVLISDIVSVRKVKDSSNYFVQLRFRVTKGNPHWNQIVTLEGDPNHISSLNCIFWLQKHLKNGFYLDLLDYENWNIKDIEEKELWHWSTHGMRELFKSRALSAGFPPLLFGFHSLRAGFICSALLKAGSNADTVKAVLENTAFVAGWVPNQAAQLAYVKTCAKKTIVASRLIMPVEENPSSNIIDSTLFSSEAFHGIQLSEPCYAEDTNFRAFHEKVSAQFNNDSLNASQNASLKVKCFSNAYHNFVVSRSCLEEEARQIYSKKPEWKSSALRCAVERAARRLVGRKFISKQLNDDFTKLEELVNEFVGLVSDEITLRKPLVQYKTKPKPPITFTRETYADTMHRKRRKWVESEDIILVNNKKNKKLWKDISPLLVDRENGDCKDRWRTLLKKYGEESLIYEAYMDKQA